MRKRIIPTKPPRCRHCGKICFGNEVVALARANELNLNVYWSEPCHKWHLTSSGTTRRKHKRFKYTRYLDGDY